MWTAVVNAIPVMVIVLGLGFCMNALVLTIKLFSLEDIVKRWASEIEGNVMLLFSGIILFAVILIFVEYRFENDSVVFQAVSSILSGMAGAFFGIMSVKKGGPAAEHPPAPAGGENVPPAQPGVLQPDAPVRSPAP